MAQTGIEIHALLTTASRVVGRLLQKIHLGALLQAAGDVQMVITLDGVERKEPLYEAHFVACEPGEHELKIAWEPYGPTLGAVARKASARTLQVTVEPGQVAIVEYMPGDQLGNMFSKAHLAGSRPA
jgi:hypothetical protein